MASVPANTTHLCTMIYVFHVWHWQASYILLMTPQLEVLKHLGHAKFDDNKSAELNHLILFGMMLE